MTAESLSREIVYARSGGDCEVRIEGVCQGRATNWHHRKNRSQGGLWRPSNGLHLCGSGTTGCHGWITHEPEVSFRKGWAVRMRWEPEDVAAFIAGRFVLLTDDGRYEELPKEA